MKSSGLKQPLQQQIEFTPQACGEVRRALDHAAATFRCWGIDLHRSTWIQAAARQLELVSKRGTLDTRHEEMQRTSRAAALVVDLYHISTCLGKEPNDHFAKELTTLLGGKLLGAGDEAPGRDLLTQFWFGALLAQSKLSPQVIAYDVDGTAKPDFLISRGKTTFAVEVKRPRSANSAERAAEKAARQLRQFEGPGIIVIDATDCLSVDAWSIASAEDEIRDVASRKLTDLHKATNARVSPHRPPVRFPSLAMLLTFARHWYWIEGEAGVFRRDAGIQFIAGGFGYLWSVQVTQLTKIIQEDFLIGFEQLTGNPPHAMFSSAS